MFLENLQCADNSHGGASIDCMQKNCGNLDLHQSFTNFKKGGGERRKENEEKKKRVKECLVSFAAGIEELLRLERDGSVFMNSCCS